MDLQNNHNFGSSYMIFHRGVMNLHRHVAIPRSTVEDLKKPGDFHSKCHRFFLSHRSGFFRISSQIPTGFVSHRLSFLGVFWAGSLMECSFYNVKFDFIAK